MNGIPVLPERASEFAFQYDWLFWGITLMAVVGTLLVFIPMIILVVKYRVGTTTDRSHPVHHNLPIELFWSLTPLAIWLVIFFFSARLYARVYGSPPEGTPTIEIFVLGKQWMWHLQHPNGVRENNELHIPKGTVIKITGTSQDVIHSFFVPAFRIKRDVLPGLYNQVWFTATKVGQYHMLCAEYCGTNHSKMGGMVYVMEPADYQKWLTDTLNGVTSTGSVPGVPLVPGNPVASAGAVVYSQLGCPTCHVGQNTRGPSHVDLYGSKVKLSNGKTVLADEAYLRESIKSPGAQVVAGYQNIMPNYSNLLTDEKVAQIIAYLKSESKFASKMPAAAGK